MTFTPSPAQQSYFDWVSEGQGNAILEAVAGAGKTTTILEGVARMSGRVWIGAFTAKMGRELKEKIAKNPELKSRQGLYTSTFHSAGFSALRFAFGRQYRLETDDKKVLNIAQAIVDNGRTDLEPLITPVAKIVSMAKNRGIGALSSLTDSSAWVSMIEHFDLDSDLPEHADLDQVVKFAQVVLKRSNDSLNVIDFDDMVYLPLQRDLRMLRHEWVLVDEAQDTNPTRRALAKKLLAPGGRFVAVGDPYQAIFGFTGADNDALDQIARDFGCTRLPLTVTYRCPKAIVAHAQNWVPHIEAHETAPTGELRTVEYQHILDEVEPGDAVLCRYNKHLVNLCFRLIRYGIPAKIEGRSIGEGLAKLAGKWKIKKLDTLRDRLEGYLKREVKKALAKDQEDKADRITDQVETLYVLIDRAEEQGVDSIADLQKMIREMFADKVSNDRMVTLCSAHKSKGLEWDRVFILGREQLMPGAFATKDWQIQQEINLIYVAVTRAMQTLVEVTDVVEDKEPRHEEHSGSDS